MTDIRNINNANLQSYFHWLDGGRDLPNQYIELECTFAPGEFHEQKIEEVYLEPRSLEIEEGKVSESQKQEWMTRYVEIGRTNYVEKICVNIENDLGGVYFYGWRNIEESPEYDKEGNMIDVYQNDLYGFVKVADNFTDFLSKLYCNGSA